MASIVAGAVLLGSCALAPEALAAARYVRDWPVERPLAAGVLKGLTLGRFPSGSYGAGGIEASPHDPYGMSSLVYEEVARLGRPQYRAGVGLGAGLWVFVGGGVIHRRLTRLQARRLESAHA